MQLMKLKLEEIHLNKDNPRKTAADASDNGSLIASIKAVGILQPPAVRKNGNGYVVAYGNRRVAAAKEIGLDEIQCLVVNDDNAEVSAIMENTARADMDPMDEYEAFVMLTKNGITEDDIADMFGVTVNRVRRRMALGKLHPNVRKEYRAGKLSLSDCMTLTLLSHKDQKAALDEGISIWSIKLNVFAGKISMRAAIFDHSLYTGKLTYDLFSKHMEKRRTGSLRRRY
jgi:ParB family transcriptional regulator, chromosome partitioning protein